MSEELSKKARRRCRVLALQTMYAFEQGKDASIRKTLDSILAMDVIDETSHDAKKFIYAIASYAKNNIAKIDEMLQARMDNWELHRLAVIDRNILRLAVAELISDLQTPLPVVINESVEIAKQFGTDDSAKFINGVLDAIKNDIN